MINFPPIYTALVKIPYMESAVTRVKAKVTGGRLRIYREKRPAGPSIMSLSTIIRNQGNDFFRQASRGTCSSLHKTKELYEKALSCYYRAKEKSENPEDECSAAKNIGKAAWKIAGVLAKTNERHQTIFFYLQEAIKGLCSAYNCSETCKPFEWRSEVQGTLGVCLQEAIDASDASGNADFKINQLERLISITTVDQATADLHVRLGTLYFHDGATKLQNGDYKACLSRMRDCYRPIEEVKRLSQILGGLDDLLREARLLEQDVFYHTCSASSIQARVQGDQLLSVALEDEEELNMSLVFEVIDWFKQAVVLAREVEIEQEAVAESRLGVVYDKVLKLKYKAKAYFNHCLQLVESLKPRMFTTDDWYKECVTALQKYQEEVRQRDEEEKRKARAGILEQLTEEIKDIEAHNTGSIVLIKYLYANYPPKNPSWVKPTDSDMAEWEKLEHGSKDYKKVLVKSLAVYHPDKVDESVHGMKWKVLSEEITKMLTNYYETTKFATH